MIKELFESLLGSLLYLIMIGLSFLICNNPFCLFFVVIFLLAVYYLKNLFTRKKYPSYTNSYKDYKDFMSNIKENREENIEEKQKVDNNYKVNKNNDDDNLSSKNTYNEYIKYIGMKLEKQGYLVIYNSFIRKSDNQEVDIISIDTKTKTTNLIKCQNLSQKNITSYDFELFYAKLTIYKPDFFDLKVNKIREFLQFPKRLVEIKNILDSSKTYSYRKTFYIFDKDTIDSNSIKYLKKIKENIYKHKDMKIVVAKFSNKLTSLDNVDIASNDISSNNDYSDIYEHDHDMDSLYKSISRGDGEDVYLSDGVWLRSDGRMDDRGR